MKRSKIKIDKKTIMMSILAFIIPILIILIHVLSMELIRGKYIDYGENFLVADMASQYNSIYAYIWDVLRGNDSIFYSFGKGLGGNMASTVGYYAASPFNILYLFCKKIDIPVMTSIIYLLKIGLCSLFMYTFLNHKLSKRKTNLMFGFMYSLMAYTVNYFFNNMWLDVILLTPLVLMGIDKLFKEKSIWFYTIFLSTAIICNFYISYMLCIFCVLYFGYQLFTQYKLKEFKKYKGIIGRFTLASLLGGGIAMVFLLPSLLNLSEIMRFPLDKSLLSINFAAWKKEIFTNILCKLYLGSHNTTSILSRNRPNLYSGMIVLPLVYFYFCNRNINLKEKIFSGLMIVFFLLSFMVPHLNLFWQAGSFPNGYICRYSFLFSFFVIYISARSLLKLDKVKIRYFLIFIVLYASLSLKIAAQYLVFIEHSDIIISSVFVCIYLIIIFLMMYLKNSRRKILNIMLCIIVIIELFINFKCCFITNSDMHMSGSYRLFYKDACNLFDGVEDEFYRVDGDYRYSFLDSWVCNNYTLTTSLSTNTGDLYRFWKNNGGSVTYTTINYDMDKLPIFDSLFGVKYIKSDDKLEDPLYKLIGTLDTYSETASQNKKTKETKYLYENPYALSLGYLVPKNHKSIYDKLKVKDSADSLNRLMKTLSGNDEDVLMKYDKKYLGKGQYEFEINNDEPYLYLGFDYDVSINWTIYDSIYIDDEYVFSSNSSDVGTIKVPNNYANKKIKVQIGNIENIDSKDNLVIYSFNMDVFKKDIEILKQHQLQNIKIDGNRMSATIETNEKSVLFTSIPYEKGWRVYIDGKRTPYEKVAGEFVGIPLNKGNHHIDMVYYPHHLGLGALITALSATTLVLYEYLIRKKQKRKKN